ncbi:hypothetical protein EVAR_76003_1 [Eumeta japonica]|uniref:Uncharacterized protein n=1 Tax=Eumeta variegata TaxID=151549 RepID=A0A4C1UAE7_EUMVA|nr:hypothetical protein EVAR_76003_1 [Eumeta japonica]
MLWSTWLQHENRLARPARYYTLIEYRYDVTDSTFAFRPVNESSDDPPPSSLFSFHQLIPPASDILFLAKKQHIPFYIRSVQAGNSLMTPLVLQVSMGDGGHLLFDDLHARMPLNIP